MAQIKTYYNDFTGSINRNANWYAIYTRPHHEKNVHKKLQEFGIKAFLPLITSLRQWSDRKKKVCTPLFSCYVFVYLNSHDYFRVLNIPGVIRYITFEGKAAAIPEKQIQLIMHLLQYDFEVEEIQESLYKGANVEITGGPLMGISGELVDFATKKRVIIRLNEISKSMVVLVPMNLLRLVG